MASGVDVETRPARQLLRPLWPKKNKRWGIFLFFLIFFYFSVILELYFKTQVESFCVLVKTTQYKNKNAPV
jgi:hypothetical protein